MDLISVPPLSPFNCAEWKLKMIAYLKSHELFDVSIGAVEMLESDDEKSFGSITVTEHMEPCVYPFLLGCIISLMLLNSQVKFVPDWTKHLANRLKRLVKSIGRVHITYPFKLFQPPLFLKKMKSFYMKK